MSISKRKSRRTEPAWLDSAGKDTRQMEFLFNEDNKAQTERDQADEPRKGTQSEAANVAQANYKKESA